MVDKFAGYGTDPDTIKVELGRIGFWPDSVRVDLERDAELAAKAKRRALAQ